MVKPATRKVPALVVSGFLGSGKTSLVRHLLEEAQEAGQRIAVISNEFGELGIDRALLGSGDEAFVELEGGCVCCELSDDLIDTLQMLWEKVHPDRIVVETSGVGLPFDTQLNFWREPVSEWIGEDMALVVVNAEQLAENRDLEGTFTDQVSSADLLVLNKMDLVPDARTAALESRLRAIEPEAPVVHSIHGRIDTSLLFPPDAAAARRQAREPRPHLHEDFDSEERRVSAGITPAELESSLQQPGILRAKGFVETSDGLRLVQVVGRRFELTEPDSDPPAELINRMVVIRRASGQEE
jgi:cobalamin biosynthesis protein CobW